MAADSRISLTRGDTHAVTVRLAYDDGTPYELAEGDVLDLTVRRRLSSEAAVVRKTGASPLFTFAPSDTRDLAPGTYVYDVQLTQADGTVTTVVGPSDFVLGGDVTR